MKKETIVTGLDIGSSKVSAVASAIDANGSLRILAQVTLPLNGVSKGAFTDLNEATDSVSRVIAKLCNKISMKPGDIYVGVSGTTLKGSKSNGMIPLALRGREVTKPDIDRCVNVASTIHLPFDREIIHKIIHNFWVDEQPPVKSPLGIYASRLSCEVYVITANVNHLQNIHKCVSNAGYDIKEIVFTGIADGAALLEQDEKDAGVALLDIGASLADISIFSAGALADLEIIAVGGQDIKGDFKDSVEFNELVAKINSKIQSNVSSGRNIGSIVLTGGMAFNDGIAEFLESALGRPIKMGVAKDIVGDISSLDSIKLTTALGLCKYAHQRHRIKLQEEKNVARTLSSKVVDIFNNYF